MTSHRLFKTIFVILILVILGELGYYAYIQFNIKKYIRADTNSTTTQMNVTTSAIYQSLTKSNQKIQIDESYMNGVTAYLVHQRDIKDGLISTSTLIDKYEGTIMEIENKKGLMPVETGGAYYSIKMRIKTKNSKETFLFFTDASIARTKIITSNLQNDKKLTISDLRVGDDVEVTYTFDLLKPATDNVTEVTIVKK